MAVIAKTLLGTVELTGSATDTYTFSDSPQTANGQESTVRILCDTSSQVVDFTLPEISEFGGLYGNLRVIVADASSNAATRNITVRAGGSDKINDAATVVIALDGGSIELFVSKAGIWGVTRAAIA